MVSDVGPGCAPIGAGRANKAAFLAENGQWVGGDAQEVELGCSFRLAGHTYRILKLISRFPI